MEFTWTALFFVVVFITPALSYLFWLRMVLPRTVPVVVDEKTTWVGLTVLGALSNLNLVGYVAKATWEEVCRHVPVKGERGELMNILFHQDFHPSRPIIRISENWLGQGHIPRTSLWAFLVDLHLRPLIYGAIVAGIVFFASKLSDWSELRQWMKLVNSGSNSKHVLEIRSKRQPLSMVLHHLRQRFLSPWAQLTYFNSMRELLMLDVLMKGTAGMYCGFFSACVTEGQDLKAVALEYTVQFSSDTPIECQSQPGMKFRKVKFVKNNGQLVIPAAEIANLHFWELRKDFTLGLQVTDPTWLDILKQYALLSVLFPSFIKEIKVFIDLVDVEKKKFLKDFAEFALTHDIPIGDTSPVKVLVLKQPSPPGAQGSPKPGQTKGP